MDVRDITEALMNDKRQFKRKKVTLNVDYDISATQKWLDSTSSNISEGGMCLTTKKPLKVGSAIKLKFLIPDSERPVNVQGTIVWNEAFKAGKHEHYYNGIQFDKVFNDDRDLITKYVENTTFDA